jgi:hypothetical protein
VVKIGRGVKGGENKKREKRERRERIFTNCTEIQNLIQI